MRADYESLSYNVASISFVKNICIYISLNSFPVNCFFTIQFGHSFKIANQSIIQFI